jgi:DnaJ family protein B protein 12
MESNKDEARRALVIAQRHRDSSNFPSARRFAEKSLKLCDTPEAHKLLASIDREEAASTAGSEAGPSTSASGAKAHPTTGGTRHHHAPSSSNGSAKPDEKPREYTAENEKVVKRVRSSKPTDYYGILGLQRDCEENDVKKAYRKVSSSNRALLHNYA